MIAFIFDTETTGLTQNRILRLDKQPEIIELYACQINLESGYISKEIDTLLKPRQFPRPEALIKETKSVITDDQLKDAPAWKDISDDVKAMIESSQLVIAHNLSFDMEMVDLEFERLGQKPSQWPHPFCTVEQTVYLKGTRLSMMSLHKYLFEEEFKDAHRAAADGKALVRCSLELYKRGMI
jgi:DNA polymerase III epsilon subunit-like protein